MHPDLHLIEGPQQAWASFDTATKGWRAIQEIFGAPPHIQLYELKKVLPRVFVPRSLDILPDHVSVLDALKQRDAESFRQIAIISSKDLTEQTKVKLDNSLNGAGEAGAVVSSSFLGDTMTVTVEMRREGLVVVTNAYHPAWTARIDGNVSHIYPVFHTFWGVIVPKGRHVITFQFGKATV
jgi:hypothetical protein